MNACINALDKSLTNLQQAQISGIEVTTVADDTDFTVIVDGVSVTIDSGAGATEESIRNALVAALDAETKITRTIDEDSEDEAKLTVTGEEGDIFSVSVETGLTLSIIQGGVDLAYQSHTGPTEVSKFLDVHWDERWVTTFVFNTKYVDFDDEGGIETVNITEEEITGDVVTVEAP
jgi:hypothetical protein